MNILSCCSLITAILFAVIITKRITGSHMDKLNFWSMLVCIFLGWWSFCDAFFYSAETVKEAWYWHHLSAIGWCGFIPVTSYYFLIMTGTDKDLTTWFRKAAFWLPALVMTIYCVSSIPTPMAEALVQSGSGLGWTFVQRYSTPLPFLFLGMLSAYFGIAFWLLRHKASPEPMIDTHMLAKGFIILDSTAILLGFVSIYIIPYFTDFLPPLGFLATLLFLIGYRFQLWDLDLTHVELSLDPGNVFESCMDAMLITNQKLCILYANEEANRIFNTENSLQTSAELYLSKESIAKLNAYILSNEPKMTLDLELNSGIPVICSINRTKTRKQSHSVFILSLHDISQLRSAQERLNYLAYYDELTGLPNRRRLGELLDEWSAISAASGRDFVLLFLDLNNFKYINDHFGHDAGDYALKAVASALQSLQGDYDITARLAGDEFIFLHHLESAPEDEIILKTHHAIRNIDCSSFAPNFELSAAIGSCRFSEAEDVRILFKLADERMYAMKKSR